MSSDLFDLRDRVALVTGGTSGIGLMAARALAQAGMRTYVTSRRREACERVAADLTAETGTQVKPLPADLTDPDECEQMARALAALEPELHLLVNNAGAVWAEPLATFPVHAWSKVLNLNLVAPFVLIRELLPALQAAARPGDPGRVVNVGSIDGLRPPDMSTYSYAASKAGLHHLTRMLAVELGPLGVTVNAIAPGPFRSRMMAATLAESEQTYVDATPLRRIGEPADIAGVTQFLASRASAFITGAVIPVDGGLSCAH